MKSKRAAWIWVGLTLGLHAVLWLREGWQTSAVPAARFVVPPASPAATNAEPIWREEFIEPQPAQDSVHASSLCELPAGQLAAAWYAGTREGSHDVAVRFATRAADGGGWSASRSLVTRATAAAETFRFVRKIGNPLLFSDGGSNVYLIYVSVSVGGWSGSSLNSKQSADGGRTWSSSRRLGLSPFFNVSELVRNGPKRLDNGWVVPVYFEFLGKFPELLWLRPNAGGFAAVKTRVFGGRHAFQPALIPLSEESALLLCRSVGSDRRIQVARTANGGVHWSAPQPIELPNPDSGLDAIRLHDGRLLLAFNDATSDRDNLRLAVSRDQGTTWGRVATIAEETGAEFSYPFLLQSRDGLVHLSYTWKRRAIKHVTFNPAWLDEQTVAASAGGPEVRP